MASRAAKEAITASRKREVLKLYKKLLRTANLLQFESAKTRFESEIFLYYYQSTKY